MIACAKSSAKSMPSLGQSALEPLRHSHTQPRAAILAISVAGRMPTLGWFFDLLNLVA